MGICVNDCYIDDALGEEFKADSYDAEDTGANKTYSDPDSESNRLYKDWKAILEKNTLFQLDEYKERSFCLYDSKSKIAMSCDFIGVNRKQAYDVGIKADEIGKYLKVQHTIGGHILLPKGKGNTINQAKGFNMLDRIDFTLAELKAYYNYMFQKHQKGDYKPRYSKLLGNAFENYEEWLRLFLGKDGDESFKKYIDFWKLNPFVIEQNNQYEVKSLVTGKIIDITKKEEHEAFFPGMEDFKQRVSLKGIRNQLKKEETKNKCKKAFEAYIKNMDNAIMCRNQLLNGERMEKIIEINDLLKYKDTPGVWAILGRKEQEWKWLNVAATANLGDEISEDVYLMTQKISKRGKDIIYKNYWNEELFTYKIFSYDKLSNKERQEKHRRARWIHISETYDELIIICCLKDEEKARNRFTIEQYIAMKTHAIYWNDVKKGCNKKLDGNKLTDIDKLIEEINKELDIGKEISEGKECYKNMLPERNGDMM